MKKLFVFAMALCLFAPMSMAQVNDSVYTPENLQSFQTTRGLGDVTWTLDLGTPTGDIRLLGVEFDGTNLWATGALDFSIANLYEVTMAGVLVNTFPQPTACWGAWGWRDLAWDGTYLYAGSDTDNPNMVTQIDPATGVPTGVYYGPFPINPCRALAYDEVNDCFWTASFTSSLYQCFKDGSSATFTNPGLSCYGAAYSPNGIWWWSQDGNGCLASLMALDGTFTGDVFDGDLSMGGGIAGGAGAYDLGGGDWEFVGMYQGSPDYAAGQDISMTLDPLTVSPSEVSAYFGGTLNFGLNGGVDNALKKYCLFGTFSGTVPGTTLPGGLNLPINWDWFTDLLLALAFNGGLGLANDFIGTLDADGNATASLVFPGHCELYTDLIANFAWCTYAPFDYVSNDVEVLVTGAPPPPSEYAYDDMSAENILGYTYGGDMAWVNWFEVIPGMETINEVGSGFGSSTYVGYGMNNGDPATVYVWDAAGGAVVNYALDDSPGTQYHPGLEGESSATYVGTGMDLTGPNPTLYLKYNGDFEGTTSTWDGFMVEVSDDGATWTQVDAGNLQGNYDAMLSTSFYNPLGGLYTFCYDYTAREVTFDLSEFNTYTNATFRFHFGWDTWETTDDGLQLDHWTVADDNGTIYDDGCGDATDYVLEMTWGVVTLSSGGGGDNDLTAGVLLDTVNVLVANVDTDFINWYALNGPLTFTNAFFVGCMVTQPAGTWVYPMDESSVPTAGQSWLLGSLAATGPLDPANPGVNDDCIPMVDIGFDCYAIVRAK